jgi:DNA-binding NarL/FixJ family response regulator
VSWPPEGWDDPDRADRALDRLARELERQHPRTRELSAQERRVLSAFALGLTRREVAEIMGLSEETVKTHVERARVALAAKNVTHAITQAFRTGQLY